jgi:UDP-2,3-diacylglucosamine hydrolase
VESYFVSDIHLKSEKERNGEILLRFLHSLQTKDPKQIQLFLLGDIFDLWVSNGQAFVKRYQTISDAILALTTKGVRIVFFEGNHDLHIAPHWKKILNVEVYTEPRTFSLGALKVRLEHGDLINLQDKAYLKLRSVLRHPWIERLGHCLPGIFWIKIGEAWSPASRKKSGEYRIRNETKLIEMIRSHAERAFDEQPFDLIITGHMHVKDDYTFQRHSCSIRSINLGSWFTETQVLRLVDGKIDWIGLS